MPLVYHKSGKLNLKRLATAERQVITAYLLDQLQSFRKQAAVGETISHLLSEDSDRSKQVIYARSVIKGLEHMLSHFNHSLIEASNGTGKTDQ